MKETKNHLGFHTDNLEEIEVEEKIRNRQKAKEKNRALLRDKETKVTRLHRGQSCRNRSRRKKLKETKGQSKNKNVV